MRKIRVAFLIVILSFPFINSFAQTEEEKTPLKDRLYFGGARGRFHRNAAPPAGTG